MIIKRSDNRYNEPRELVIAELDAVVGGKKSDDAAKDAAFHQSSAAHRDRSRDAVLDFLGKMSQIKGLY